MHGLANQLIVIDLEHATLISVLQRILEVLGDLFLAKLPFNAIDDGHDALNILIKDVALLQALERDLTLLWAASTILVAGEDVETFVRYVIHDRRRALI